MSKKVPLSQLVQGDFYLGASPFPEMPKITALRPLFLARK